MVMPTETDRTCKNCGQPVRRSAVPGMLLNPDGTKHICQVRQTAEKPRPDRIIGERISGLVVKGLSLRDRRLIITFDGGGSLEISAGGRHLSLRLLDNEGLVVE